MWNLGWSAQRGRQEARAPTSEISLPDLGRMCTSGSWARRQLADAASKEYIISLDTTPLATWGAPHGYFPDIWKFGNHGPQSRTSPNGFYASGYSGFPQGIWEPRSTISVSNLGRRGASAKFSISQRRGAPSRSSPSVTTFLATWGFASIIFAAELGIRDVWARPLAHFDMDSSAGDAAGISRTLRQAVERFINRPSPRICKGGAVSSHRCVSPSESFHHPRGPSRATPKGTAK